jgi:hypothetical protein
MEKTEIISPKIKNETRVPVLLTPIQHSPGITSQSNKARRRNKINTNRLKKKKTQKLSKYPYLQTT